MNKIAKYRRQAKVSQAILAKAVGVMPSTIGNYESGIRNISLTMCWKIVGAFKRWGIYCSLEDVFPEPQPKHSVFTEMAGQAIEHESASGSGH
ncbi:antitoxin HipB [Vibrio aerogenes CECT 7868]|uniref:Antitoxin HipB n=1 Tax=Vibrio aerogenes CECT 7868 TaxID=1216006 RepID=A0A1M6B747_9VIBR|nr:helix-turn-helix transcriptional regulator [Vibrio aerogenes]SHI44418.1 antitoxin HipB [Vibrio aerogenes CECT 7868]